MPSMDLEFLGSDIVFCDFDIFTVKRNWIYVNGVKTCDKGAEFTPLIIDPEKLKKYIVLYTDMTAEDMSDPKKPIKHQVKSRFQRCNETHFTRLGFEMTP